jgi:sulfatase maturation enzyme AslB (radical SAM superfamily)
VLISYHLPKNVNYNSNIFPNGCTYTKVKNTIKCAKANNILIRTNTVLATFNIDVLNNIIEDLYEFKPKIINFLPINLFDQAKNMDKYINYSILRN